MHRAAAGPTIAFIGDTARLPYGSKSRRTIARYAAQSARFLVSEQGAEFLVIACNTASALALDAIQEALVFCPGDWRHRARRGRCAGSLEDRRRAGDRHRRHRAEPCICRSLQRAGLARPREGLPLLVPLVEEGWTDSPGHRRGGPHLSRRAHRRSRRTQAFNPDTLVLGCTHYPLLEPLIERAVPPGMTSHRLGRIHRRRRCASSTASCCADDLGATAADRNARSRSVQIRCFATDSVEKFERLGSRFLGRPVGEVELVDLGG